MAIVVAVSAVMIFALAALVVDLGMARDTGWRAQNAADASALAAANALYTLGETPHYVEAVQAAKDYADRNYGVTASDWALCTDSNALPVQPGGTACISFAPDTNTTDPYKIETEVRVVMPARRVPEPFSEAVGGPGEIRVSAMAQVHVQPNTKARCALCVLGSGPHDLQNGEVTVAGGDVHFNGDGVPSTYDVKVGPHSLVATDGSITVQGTADGSLSQYTPDPTPNQPRIEDPLAFMAAPDYSGLSPRTDPCTGGPGIYGGFSAGCTSPLSPGLYVITGEWKFTNNEKLIGDDVTLYFTCSTPLGAPRPCASSEAGGWLNAAGNDADIEITAPTSGPTKGLAIMYDRNNTSQLKLSGSGGSQYLGTIYAPQAKLDYRGNGSGVLSDSLLVVGSISFSGSGTELTSTYLGDNNVDMPPTDLHLSK